MGEREKGVMAMVAACVIWGLSPLYYKQLAHVPPLEVLSHRTLWSMVFFGTWLGLQRRLGEVAALLRGGRTLGSLLAASLLISVNWFFFIYSVQVGRAVEASLGYYIYPLVAVMLGYLVLGEGLSRPGLVAVVLATLAVALLSWGLGAPPWISLLLAVSFGLYGVIKSGTGAGPVVGVTAEVLLLAPLAAIWLWGVHRLGWQGLVGRNLATFGDSLRDSLLLVCAGPITAGPLVLFSYASKRLRMATVGLVGYLNPSLQFLVATLVFAEPLTRWHLIAFPMIWVALAVYSAARLRRERPSRSAAISASGEATALK